MSAETLLKSVDRTSDTWHAVIVFAKYRVEQLRDALQRTNSSHEDDILNKGKIQAFNELIGIANKLDEGTT